MKILSMTKYIVFWGCGLLILKLTWFSYLASISKNDVYLIHGGLWPTIIFTICWTITFGLIIEDKLHD